jgi:hypothetical protein
MTRQTVTATLCLALLAALTISAQRTNRSRLRVDHVITAAADSAPTADCDTIIGNDAAANIHISGFDKTLRARRESFFVTNTSADTVSAISLTLTYLDTSGRMLHRVSRRITAEIPANETRQLTIPTWDSQQSFYYRLSAQPKKTSVATPFDVSIAIDTVYIHHHITDQR